MSSPFATVQLKILSEQIMGLFRNSHQVFKHALGFLAGFWQQQGRRLSHCWSGHNHCSGRMCLALRQTWLTIALGRRASSGKKASSGWWLYRIRLTRCYRLYSCNGSQNHVWNCLNIRSSMTGIGNQCSPPSIELGWVGELSWACEFHPVTASVGSGQWRWWCWSCFFKSRPQPWEPCYGYALATGWQLHHGMGPRHFFIQRINGRCNAINCNPWP